MAIGLLKDLGNWGCLLSFNTTSNEFVRAPYSILFASNTILVILVALHLFVAPTGLNAWVIDLVFWLLAFAVFIAGYWLFTSRNQTLQRSPSYITDPVQPVKYRMVYLAAGFVLNCVTAWPLADELSRVWFS